MDLLHTEIKKKTPNQKTNKTTALLRKKYSVSWKLQLFLIFEIKSRPELALPRPPLCMKESDIREALRISHSHSCEAAVQGTLQWSTLIIREMQIREMHRFSKELWKWKPSSTFKSPKPPSFGGIEARNTTQQVPGDSVTKGMILRAL